MKKYVVLLVALLFASLTVITAQTKVVANKVQLTNEDTKNAPVLGTDGKGNIVAKELPEVDLSGVQNALNAKLDAGTYTGTAGDLASQISEMGSSGGGDFVPYTGADKEIDLTDSKIVFKSKAHLNYPQSFSENDVELNNHALSFRNIGEYQRKLDIDGDGVRFIAPDNESSVCITTADSYWKDNYKLYLPSKTGVLATISDVYSELALLDIVPTNYSVYLDPLLGDDYNRPGVFLNIKDGAENSDLKLDLGAAPENKILTFIVDKDGAPGKFIKFFRHGEALGSTEFKRGMYKVAAIDGDFYVFKISE